jgi:phosphatidate cytidylyltransferase
MGAGGEPSPQSPPSRASGELGTRVVSALVLGILALFAVFRGGWLFALFWLVAGLATLFEWTSMTRVEPRRLLQGVLFAGLLIVAAAMFFGASYAALGTAAGAVAAAAAIARNARDRLWSVAGFLYAVVIVLVPPVVRDHPELGLAGLLWMFAVVWTTDIAAFFTGRSVGGPKLFPRVSPKKTWSGFAGGLAGGITAGVLVALAAERFGVALLGGWTKVVLVSATASVASQLGDLGESALKRAFDVKDSGHLIPGHGGVMDRVDGFWAVCALVGVALLIAPVLP